MADVLNDELTTF